MSALLSVIEGNPRRRRRSAKKRTHKARARKSTRRRRRSTSARVSNPRRRRRLHARRRNPSRRRRHRNPVMGGGIVGTLIKGATAGIGVIAANAATAAVNHFGFNGTMTGPTKILLKAGVGAAGYMALKALKKPSLASAFLVGAGIAVALDAYQQFVQPTVVAQAPWLADYDYGSLSGYREGNLQGWAPQPGVSGWAPQGALSGGDGDAYAGGAY